MLDSLFIQTFPFFICINIAGKVNRASERKLLSDICFWVKFPILTLAAWRFFNTFWFHLSNLASELVIFGLQSGQFIMIMLKLLSFLPQTFNFFFKNLMLSLHLLILLLNTILIKLQLLFKLPYSKSYPNMLPHICLQFLQMTLIIPAILTLTFLFLFPTK